MSQAEVQDAGRRTRLANERTYLAWWRTGLTSLAVAIGVGKIVPNLSNVTEWPYQALGAAYGILGVGFMVIAHLRVRAVERAVDAGSFARLDQRLGTALLLLGATIGAATVALIVFGS